MEDFLTLKTLDTDDDSLSFSEESDQDIHDIYQSRNKKKSKEMSQKKSQSVFASDFSFNFMGSNEEAWEINQFVKNKAKGQISTEVLDKKIVDKRKEISQKRKEASTNSNSKTISADKDEMEASDIDTDSDTDDSSEEESSDEEERQPFFVKPPPQVKHKHFSQMNLSRPLLKAVNELNFTHPTKIQSSTIPVALLGKDICACATTGSGKTAAFMLPILERLLFKPKQSPVTRVLVLVPTRELAIQVHSVSLSLCKYTSIQMCLAAGGLDSKVQEAILRKNPDVIIATPGRLIDHLHNTPSFTLQTIEILVLDEADRMLEEHFKDQMEELIRLSPRGRQTMLFSATMTDEVEALASLSLNQPVKIFVSQNTDVAANLHQEFVRVRPNRESDRLPIVVGLCVRSFHEHTLVFLQTKWLAHKMRIILGLLGLKVAELHGNLTQLQRLEALEKFKKSEVDILVATDLAARGLDISGVKTVISFNMPTTLKSYIHRVGRTARAGKAGRSITLVGEKERKMLKEVVKNAQIPVKNRIISTEIIEKFRKKIESFEADIKDILKQEEEDKELRIAEMQMKKAKNLIEHHDEIMSRPPKTFIKPNKSNKEKQDKKQKDTKNTKKKKEMSEEDKKIRKLQEFQIRQTKRERKPKRIRAFDDTDEPKPRKGSKQSKLLPSKRSFDRELTDTSKKRLKSLRTNENSIQKKKKIGGSFKSKSKHRRRKK